MGVSREALKDTLQKRFEENMDRHKDLSFEELWDRLVKDEKNLSTVENMEESGGCPDFVKVDGKIIIFDFYDKIPPVRKSLCYDKEALLNRKKNKPKSDVMTEVKKLGSKLVSEDLYYKIQEVFKFDEKISSWIKTPDELRSLGGAIFCDRRFDRVFTYHNGAESYYASRGFRTYIELDK